MTIPKTADDLTPDWLSEALGRRITGVCVEPVGVGVGLVVLCASIYVCVRFAGHLERLLGTAGTQVAMRLCASVIFCIGVEILWLGLSELIASVHLTIK